MTPAQFERLVAKRFEADGYRTRLTPTTNDWGVDIFAERGTERVAIQVKMYAGARPINRQMVFEIVGAAAYFDCTGAAIATNGEFRADARKAAMKLGVRILDDFGALGSASRPERETAAASLSHRPADLNFESIWSKHVIPLAGRTLVNDRGLTNTIIGVDWGGVRRVSSTGARSRIPVEPFRWAIETILEYGSVTRQEINEQYAGRASSGIQLILAEVPAFEVVVIDNKSTIRLRSTARR